MPEVVIMREAKHFANREFAQERMRQDMLIEVGLAPFLHDGQQIISNLNPLLNDLTLGLDRIGRRRFNHREKSAACAPAANCAK